MFVCQSSSSSCGWCVPFPQQKNCLAGWIFWFLCGWNFFVCFVFGWKFLMFNKIQLVFFYSFFQYLYLYIGYTYIFYGLGMDEQFLFYYPYSGVFFLFSIFDTINLLFFMINDFAHHHYYYVCYAVILFIK